MTFSDIEAALADLLPRPVIRYGMWRQRMRFRHHLARLLDEPHRAADMGFRLSDVAAECRRRPWEPVRLRRA